MGYAEADPSAQYWISEFVLGLAQLGWVAGKTIGLVYRFATEGADGDCSMGSGRAEAGRLASRYNSGRCRTAGHNDNNPSRFRDRFRSDRQSKQRIALLGVREMPFASLGRAFQADSRGVSPIEGGVEGDASVSRSAAIK